MPTHRCFFIWLGTIAILFTAPAARAETPPQIDRVRVGLPAGMAGQDSGRSRNGAWAPVAITLKSGSEGNPQGVYRIRIETKDLEDLTYQFTVAVPALAGTSERTVLGYTVPAGEGAEFRLHLEKGGRVLQTVKLSRDTSKDEVLGASDILFLAAGAGLSQLKRAAEKLDRPEGKDAELDPEAGRRQFVFADEVPLLPDRWFGYDAVDVVVLATGKRDFVNHLAQDSESARRNALLEWVRRGGQLVLSVGRNKQEVSQLLGKMALLDCKVTGSQVVGSPLMGLSHWCNRAGHRQALQHIEVAKVVAGKGVHVMLRDDGRPLVLEASCGLGRVFLVAFDLDTPPFTTWDGQLAFWTRLQAEVAPFLPVRGARPGRKGGPVPLGPPAPPGGPGMPGLDEGAPYDFRAQLRGRLENIDQVPVIEFYWVALFVLCYIALVGPLDYFVLKKLFKRLELTWITFPLTVLIVSVSAYAIAYACKGDEVRVKKVDVVEVDLHQPQQVYGHTWFTLFSPRAQSYTIGLEPAVGIWTAPVPPSAPGPVVTLLEGGDRTPRTGSSGLFPRPYEYAEEAQGLLRVPVPVWATRAFAASWRAPIQAKQPPIGINDEVGPIRKARDGEGLVGRLTNNLPTELRSVALFFQEKWYSLGTLAPGESRRVEALFARDAQGQNRQFNQWLHVSPNYNPQDLLAPGLPLAPTGRPIPKLAEERSTFSVIKPLLFYRAYRSADDSAATNAGLRNLDQTWRLRPLPEDPPPLRERFRDEAILVARTPMLVDRAEAVSGHGASASHLWIGELPAPGAARPDLPGYITQETYLRVFIPVGSRE